MKRVIVSALTNHLVDSSGVLTPDFYLLLVGLGVAEPVCKAVAFVVLGL